MSKFGKKEKGMQAVPTSALPDIIFILLFFFMVATKPIEQTKVKVNQPKATELQELDKPHLVYNLYAGLPMNEGKYGKKVRIQANDVLITPKHIPIYIEKQRTKLGKNASLLQINLKVDENTKMGTMHDIQEQLRIVDARNISYAVRKNTGK